MESIQNDKLKAALELFLNQNTHTFTFGRPEMYEKTGITLSQSDVEQLFDILVNNKEKLHELYLNGLGIKEIPTTIGQLSNLTTLSLIYNEVEKLPDEVCYLKELYTLSLSNNKISYLPENIGELKKLNWIDLNRNPIENLPDSIINLKNLEKMNLMVTGIKKTDVNKIEQLEQLCINASKSSNDTVKYYTRNGEIFYENPKISIDGIGSNRKQNKNVLSKHDFDNIIRGIRYPSPKATKRKSIAISRRSPSPKSKTLKSKKSRKTPTPSP
jgi:Leucine-rich repeat (LRR) protein